MNTKAALFIPLCLVLLPFRPIPAQADAGLEEIVVTARKREESLQDTPISITTLSGAALAQQHVDRLDGIAAATPNLVFDTGTTFSGSSSAAAVYIRGIGQIDFSLNSEPGVGIYVDGVYVATTIGSVLDLVDIDRVEVLRGPQGTLFGRNTIGGAINVISKQPDDTLHGDLKVTAGSYDRIDVHGKVNVPVTDSLFASFAAATYNRDGFVDAPNTTDGEDLGDVNRDAFRAALRYAPGGRFEANFSADYSRQRESGVPNVLIGTYEGTSLALIGSLADPNSPTYLPPPAPLPPPSFVDLHNLLATTPLGLQGGIAGVTPGVVPNPLFGQPTLGSEDVIDIDNDNLFNPSTGDYHADADIWGVALTLDLDLDFAQVKSITAYRDMETDIGTDMDATFQDIAQLGNSYDSEQFSEELQVTGAALDDRLNWLLGFYYFEQDGIHLDYLVNFTGARVFSGTVIENRSTAGFGQLTFDVTDRLSVTAGVRYTDERKDFVVPDRCYEIPGGPVTLLDGTVVTCAQLHTVLDPKFSNAGFLQFVNAPVFPDPGGRICCIPIADDEGNIVGLLPGVTAGQEVLPRGRTRRNFSAWTPMASITYHWTDDLMTYFSYSEGFKSGGYVQRIFPPRTAPPSFDAETAQVFEVGLKWTGLDNRLRASAAGFHTEYDDMHVQVNDNLAAVTKNAAAAEIDGFELEVTALPARGWLVQGGVGYMHARYTELADFNLVTDLYVLSLDSNLVNAPEWTTNLGLEYSHAVPRLGGTLIARLDWRYQSAVNKDAINFPDLRQDGYHLLDLGLTYVSADEKWELAVFGKNVTDERYIVSGFANALQYGVVSATVGRPAEWGVSFAYHFGQ